MLQSVDELHSFLCQQRRMDTILGIRHVPLSNAHPTHPSWGLTEPSSPSQPALALYRSQSDVAIALLVRSSLALLGPLATSRTSTDTDERLQESFFRGTYCIARPGQLGWSTIITLSIMSLICSRAESEEYEPDVLFFNVLWLYGTSSGGNSNTPFTLSSSSFAPLLSW